MKEELLRKLSDKSACYTMDELTWLLEHIGVPDPKVRDELVFQSLTKGIIEACFTTDQLRFLMAESRKRELLRSKSVLTRSFTSLLYSNLLEVDGDVTSPFVGFLESDDRNFLFAAAISYLVDEKDWLGHDAKNGWVHAHAHGADFLVAAVTHPDFPTEKWTSVMAILKETFLNLPLRPTNGEEWRLACVLYQPICQKKLEQELVVTWLASLNFSLVTPLDYQRYETFCSFLLDIYLQVSKENQLSKSLKLGIENFIQY